MNSETPESASGAKAGAALDEEAAQMRAERDCAERDPCRARSPERDELRRLLDALLNDRDCEGGAELDVNGIARIYVKVEALDAARKLLARLNDGGGK